MLEPNVVSFLALACVQQVVGQSLLNGKTDDKKVKSETRLDMEGAAVCALTHCCRISRARVNGSSTKPEELKYFSGLKVLNLKGQARSGRFRRGTLILYNFTLSATFNRGDILIGCGSGEWCRGRVSLGSRAAISDLPQSFTGSQVGARLSPSTRGSSAREFGACRVPEAVNLERSFGRFLSLALVLEMTHVLASAPRGERRCGCTPKPHRADGVVSGGLAGVWRCCAPEALWGGLPGRGETMPRARERPNVDPGTKDLARRKGFL